MTAVYYPKGKRYLTRYSATKKLLDRFPKSLGTAMPAFVPQAQNINLIRVQQNFKTEVNGVRVERKKLLEYEETSHTKLMRANLQKINDTINQFWFDSLALKATQKKLIHRVYVVRILLYSAKIQPFRENGLLLTVTRRLSDAGEFSVTGRLL